MYISIHSFFTLNCSSVRLSQQLGLKFIELGDISVKIDWGYAKDYVYYAWKILQLPNPDFFIIGTGKNNSVKTFLQKTFEKLGLNYKDHLKINKKLFRPAKTVNLIADTKKAKKTLRILQKKELKLV